ncbi:PREDICTED: leucine-rich repeat-containing protein 24-like isoform X2 [Branchiostoma belcheri]|uniref:Leucine-rich repeat-containing protein 24-like isoform X2 n=1 Tax=Branchiostoma belcheri TaxID=7741 RepID=A0A6P4ZVG2_BRABE|nr:PREDICTED: leucine-rich repeat-containing protein 24-like isoform X2 [Branchiostoma belcheri]
MASSVEVLLWALSLMLAATGYAHGVRACDSDSQTMRCSCSSGLTGGVTVDCVGEGLEEVPDGIPPRTTILQLNDNSIRALPRNRFSRFPDLTRLYIDHNGLSDIRTGAFYHLNLLDLLSLQYNKLTSLPCSEFSSLPNLRRLKFSGNPISSIPDNCFDDLVNLERLYLQNMRLRTISHVPFQRLSNLRHLDISGNRLSTLPPAFCNQGQNLIPSISLDANPWVCDCEMIPIRSCSNVSSAITCAMPSTLRGLTMGTVSSERMGCSSTPITVDPSETVATAGQAVHITCQADGVEKRDVTWWKMSKSIGVELFRNGRMLAFESVKPENAGIYMCEALTSWAVASLVVLPAPPTTARPSTTVQTTVTPTKKTSLPANPFGGPTSTDAPSPTRASSKNNTPLPNAGGPLGGGTTTVTNTPKQVSKKGNLEGGGSGQFDWKMVAAAAGGAIVTLLIIGGVCYVWNQRRWKKSLQKYEGPVPLGDLESAHDDDSDSVRSARSNRSNRSNRSKSSNSIPVRKPPRAIPDQIDDSNQEDIDLYVDMENAPPRRSGRRPAGSRANTARRHGSNLAVNNPSRRGSRTSLASRASSRASSRGPTRGNPSARRPRSGYTSADSARASRRRDDLMPSQRVVIEVDDYDEDDYQDTPDGTPVNPRRANMKSPLVGVKRGTMSRSRSSENARRAAYNGDREIDIDSGKGSSKDITMLTSDEDYNGIHSDVSLTKGRRKRPMEFDGRRHSDMVY